MAFVQRPVLTVRGIDNKNSGYLFAEDIAGTQILDIADDKFEVSIVTRGGTVLTDMTYPSRQGGLDRADDIMRFAQGGSIEEDSE